MTELYDVMIDLETLGTTPDSAILAIGAVKFDPHTGEQREQFYTVIEFEDADKRKISAATVKWWMQQDEDARMALVKPASMAIDLETALVDFGNFLSPGDKVWGNGATFDISMLEHAYGYEAPWKFWNVRDVRTVVDIASGLVDRNDTKFVGQAHNALDDAIHQAKYVSAMVMALRANHSV